MTADSPPPEPDVEEDQSSPPGHSADLGPSLRRAWLGYQRRLDEAMAEAGFNDRRFPDGRVLRLCSNPSGSTISAIGRELDMTRQGAGKVVGFLRDRGYLSVADSATSRREKSVTITTQGAAYLAAQRKAARSIDGQLRAELGEAGLAALGALLHALGQGEEARMRSYLQRSGVDVRNSC
jgi:DNA-binding MarR family transcriptional regulator